MLLDGPGAGGNTTLDRYMGVDKNATAAEATVKNRTVERMNPRCLARSPYTEACGILAALAANVFIDAAGYNTCIAAVAIAMLYRIVVTSCHTVSGGSFSALIGTTIVSPAWIGVPRLNHREPSLATTLPFGRTT